MTTQQGDEHDQDLGEAGKEHRAIQSAESQATSELNAAPPNNAVVDFYLIESVREKARFLHMGYSPVKAIERCFMLANEGIVKIDSEGWMSLAPVTRAALVTQK